MLPCYVIEQRKAKVSRTPCQVKEAGDLPEQFVTFPASIPIDLAWGKLVGKVTNRDDEALQLSV